jgi:hypothetical protein
MSNLDASYRLILKELHKSGDFEYFYFKPVKTKFIFGRNINKVKISFCNFCCSAKVKH